MPTPRRSRRREAPEGSVMPLVLVALVALVGASALAVDAGLLWTARTQLQGTVDASALAAAANLNDTAGPSVTANAALAAASGVAAANTAVPTASVELAQVRIGRWDFDARSFDATVDAGDPDQVDAVDVRATLDGAANRAVPAFMARVLGRDAFTVSAGATAWLGFAGSAAPGEVDLPIAVDCCSLQGASCASDYCDTLETNPPFPCPLLPAEELVQGTGLPQHTDTEPVSCLDLNSTPVQNACWTGYQAPRDEINTPLLRSLAQDGNSHDLSVDDLVGLKQGEFTPVFGEIMSRFDAEGSDRYPPFDDRADSWVVRLPVVSCQQGSPACYDGTITGFACFEMRQVERNPGKIVRGRFLCRERDAELFGECAVDGSRSGGGNFGIRAEIPVLVR